MRFTKWFRLARHFIWLAPLALGFVFVVGGIYMISEGNAAKDEVRSALVAENIITSDDASIQGVLVNSEATARSEAAVIDMHVLEITGGKRYADLDRDDPLRDTALRAVNLRTSLNLAVMGFNVSDLVIGMGVFMVVIGGAFVLFMAPAVYYSAEVANHYDQLMKEKKGNVSGTPHQQSL